MAKTIQQAFRDFHSDIKLYIDDHQTLIDKRDMFITELKTYFSKLKADGGPNITFKALNQGSYSMGTGVKPLDGEDYDIDIMLLFDIDKDDYNAKKVKKWVYDALNKTARTVDILKPCVRVQYHKAGEICYHVDLAVYAAKNGTYLSKKPKSKNEDEVWESSEPEKLKQKIKDKFTDKEERHQLKRTIIYMKRWKDLKFKGTKNGRPTGIAITALAYEKFVPVVNKDLLTEVYKPNDLKALRNFVASVIGQINMFTNEICVNLPVEPYNDLFGKMTTEQKKNLKSLLESLLNSLDEAIAEVDPSKASKILRKVFGDVFPEIPVEQTAENKARAFVSSPDQA
jgi:hypothetical protein